MGKRGPKPQFIDIACPNKACELYGLTNQGTVVGNGTSISRGENSHSADVIQKQNYSCYRFLVFAPLFEKISGYSP